MRYFLVNFTKFILIFTTVFFSMIYLYHTQSDPVIKYLSEQMHKDNLVILERNQNYINGQIEVILQINDFRIKKFKL